MSVWEALDCGKRRDLTSQDKFMLLSPDAMLREGIEEETAFVFTLKVSKNPLRQVFGADSTDRPPLPPSQSPSLRPRRSLVNTTTTTTTKKNQQQLRRHEERKGRRVFYVNSAFIYIHIPPLCNIKSTKLL